MLLEGGSPQRAYLGSDAAYERSIPQMVDIRVPCHVASSKTCPCKHHGMRTCCKKRDNLRLSDSHLAEQSTAVWDVPTRHSESTELLLHNTLASTGCRTGCRSVEAQSLPLLTAGARTPTPPHHCFTGLQNRGFHLAKPASLSQAT